LTDASNHHLQKAHNRKRTVGEDKTPRIHNGESALQAATADLLNVWAIDDSKAEFSNPYVLQADDDREKIATAYRALAETWTSPELRMWHSKLGDFWGPIVMNLRVNSRWLTTGEALNTGDRHGYVPKSDEEIPIYWHRGDCLRMKDDHKHCAAIEAHVKPAHESDDYFISDDLWKEVRADDRDLVTREPSPLEEPEILPLETGKNLDQLRGWAADLEYQITQNADIIKPLIANNDPSLQGKFEKMAQHMKTIWEHATPEQRSLWNEMKRVKFGSSLLNTRLIDVICFFESRWIPQDHCACPICWEAGKAQKFTALPDFINHMKDAHKVGWKNANDFWCMTVSRILHHAVYLEAIVPGNGKRIELANPYAWCPYPHRKHSHEKGAPFRDHFEK
jgi:hypothetical protein